ncbi:hypothetical protein RIF29_40580 [Crotalaria pallida]|uniref:Uncharacterized protein n=1 Tax=Crotalaria pallida TaxID=3830 RepID=A0AAN9HQT7_CROPI
MREWVVKSAAFPYSCLFEEEDWQNKAKVGGLVKLLLYPGLVDIDIPKYDCTNLSNEEEEEALLLLFQFEQGKLEQVDEDGNSKQGEIYLLSCNSFAMQINLFLYLNDGIAIALVFFYLEHISYA